MNISHKFAALDIRELALFGDMPLTQCAEYNTLNAMYHTNFAPATDKENDAMSTLVTLRWSINRVRAAEAQLRIVYETFGYTTPSAKRMIDEMGEYHRELNARYERFFSVLIALQGEREGKVA